MGTTDASEYRRQLIGGRWIEGRGGERDSIDPFSRETWTVITDASAADVDDAVTFARETFRTWRRVTGYERSKLLFRFAGHAGSRGPMSSAVSRLATTARSSARTRIRSASRYATSASSPAWRTSLGGETKQLDNYDTVDFTTREPRGVVVFDRTVELADFRPSPTSSRQRWRQGNVVIVKPSEHTSARHPGPGGACSSAPASRPAWSPWSAVAARPGGRSQAIRTST